jgi:hypothetical protein
VISDGSNVKIDKNRNEDTNNVSEEIEKLEAESPISSKNETEQVEEENPQSIIDTTEQIEDLSYEEDEESSEQPTYIGRTPPANYVEPESLDPSQIESQLALKDTYQSNIVIIPEELLSIDINDYEWYHPTSEYGVFSYGYTVHFVCYAILTYYDGEVPCDYYVDLENDKHNRHYDSAKIFEMQTYGEKPLNICIDMYNYKIRVEEGIKKEE